AAGEAGWLVTLATGRRWASTAPVATDLGLRVPLIVFNGAVVRDSVNGEILHYNPLPPGTVAPLVGAIVARGLQPVLYEDLRAGERLLTGPAENDGEVTGRWLANIAADYGQVVHRLALDDLARLDDAVRIVVYDTVERMRGIDALAEEVGLDHRTLLYPVERHGSIMAELLHPAGTKASAIAALAARYELTLADVVAVGDGHNDVEMLAEAGLGVAMGQAPPEVRDRAAIVIGDHADEGLAAFIEEELLPGEGFPHHLRAGGGGRQSARERGDEEGGGNAGSAQ
ncbi:MAG: hypothetical protein AVDCRST_MAG88-3206, partial [uncultured Thermomicrobiales bacterium]